MNSEPLMKVNNKYRTILKLFKHKSAFIYRCLFLLVLKRAYSNLKINYSEWFRDCGGADIPGAGSHESAHGARRKFNYN